MALFRKQGQTQVVDEFGNLQNYTGNLDALPIYNSSSNVITANNLQPVNPINIGGTFGNTNLPSVEGDMAFFTNLQNNQSQEEKNLASQKQAFGSEIEKLLGELAGKPLEQLNLEKASIDPLNKKLSEASGLAGTQLAEYNALKTAFEQQSADIEAGAGKKGLTTGAVMGQQGAVARAAQARLNTKASEIALTQANVLALQGQVEAAQKAVDRAVNLKYSFIENQLTIRKNQLDSIKEDLTSAEKKRWEAQQYALGKEEKRVAEKKEEEKISNNYLLTAIQGKAPQSLITKAQDLINKGASSNQVAQVLGKYSMSLSDRLDIELKQTQLNKLNNEISKSNPDAGDLVKINGKDYIRYKDGTISDPILPEAGDKNMVVTRLKNKINEIDLLTNNTGGVGLATSAGQLRGSPIPFLFKGKINDWRANIKNLTSKLTVDELGRVKSDGVTFGALSNGERLAVGEAATALNAAMITRGRGDDKKATGKFKMSEREVLRQLNIIRDAYLLDFQKRTGYSYDEYQKNPDIIVNSLVDDFIDQSGTALINNNVYGGYPID